MDHLGLGVVFDKSTEKGRIRPTKAVNGLVRIADHAQISRGRHQKTDEPVLTEVQILVFINENVGEAPAAALAIGRIGFEPPNHIENQILEIQQALTGHQFGIGGIGPGKLAGGRFRSDGFEIGLRPPQALFGIDDLFEQFPGV